MVGKMNGYFIKGSFKWMLLLAYALLSMSI